MGILTNAVMASVLPTHDLDASRSFYVDKLGLTLDEGLSSDGSLVLMAGEHGLVIYLKDKTKAEHTALGFMVDDVRGTVADLKSKGIAFEEYDIPEMDLKTVDGIAEMNGNLTAFFKDPAGNILTVSSM